MNAAAPDRGEFVVVLLGGLGLAGVAGYVNTMVLALGGPPVSHLTGTISRLSSDLGAGDMADARFVAGLVACFVIGAALSGVIIGSSNLRLGRRYGVAIALESVLLALAAGLIEVSLPAGAMLAAAAAGLQNAMASSYRSLIVRTTHVTGVLTDLGFQLGQMLGGHRIEKWRFAMLGMLLVAFAVGGILGVLAFVRFGADGLWIPAGATAVGGGAYFAWRVRAAGRRLL